MAKIKLGKQKFLELGNLKAKRDWGHSRDYVDAMWRMLQQKKPQDFVIGTGETHSVKEFAKIAFSYAGLDYKKHVKISKKFFRPAEVDLLVGDYSKARKILKWEPKTNFRELVIEMTKNDIDIFK